MIEILSMLLIGIVTVLFVLWEFIMWKGEKKLKLIENLEKQLKVFGNKGVLKMEIEVEYQYNPLSRNYEFKGKIFYTLLHFIPFPQQTNITSHFLREN